MYWNLAFKNIFRNKARSLVTVTAVTVGCVSLIVAGGFIQAGVSDLTENYIQAYLGHVQIYKKGFLEKGALAPLDFMIEKPEELDAELARLPGVLRAAPRIEFSGLLSSGETSTPCLVQAVDPGREQSSMLRIVEGKNLVDAQGHEVIVGFGLAKALKARPGDSLALLTTTRGGALNGYDLTVAGVFRTASKGFDDRAVRVPLKTAQQLLRVDEAQRLTLFLDKTERTDAAKAALQALFLEKSLSLEAQAWHEMDDADFVVKLVGYYHRLFRVFKIIIFIVVVLSVFNTMNMSVLERVGEIGTMMALGVKTRGILSLFLTEGLLLGLIGGALGLALGCATAKALSIVGIPMGVPPGSTMEWVATVWIVPEVLVFAFAQAVITALISSSYPAWRASKIEIAEALRQNV